MRSPMDSTGHKFLARPGFAGDQNGGIGRSYFGHARKYFSKDGRRSDDLLEHRCLVYLFTQGDVLMLESLFSQFAIVDIGRRDIPTRDASLFIAERIAAEKKPAILPVSSQYPCFALVRDPV